MKQDILTARPLAGKRILVTRARKQAGSLARRLADLGAVVVELPTIEIVPAPPEPIDDAIRRLGAYDWVVFTSVNGVDAFFGRIQAIEAPSTIFDQIQVGAIGRATARRLEENDVGVAFVPERFVAESMVEGMVRLGVAGKHVLLPRADIARDTLPAGLRAAGARVDIVVAYRTQPPRDVDREIVEQVRRGDVDIVTFASPSTVRNLADMLGDDLPPVAVACIGPITAAAARERAFDVRIVAEEYSAPGLVEALIRYVGTEQEGQ